MMTPIHFESTEAGHIASGDVRQLAFRTLEAAIEVGEIRCGVIGLGFIGSVLMDALLAAGLDARGFDRSEAAVRRFEQAHPTVADIDSAYACGTDPSAIQGCNVVFVAVRNPVDHRGVDDEPLRAAAHVLAQHPVRPLLVILESTVTPGTTRRFAQEWAAEDVFVAHAPERLGIGQGHEALRSLPHLVAGLDAQATRLAAVMLSRICDHVVPVSAPEVSELSKLLENAFLSVNIGLTAEITRLSAALGVRAQEVCAAAATKSRGFMAFHPGAGLGGHCLPNDLALLADTARGLGWEPELLSGAIIVNQRAPALVVERLASVLARDGRHLAAARVLLIGVGFKPGSGDTLRSPALDVGRLLMERGAVLAWIDALAADFSIDGQPVPRIRAEQLDGERFTAGIVLSGDATLNESQLLAVCGCVLDAGGSRAHRPADERIETL